MNTIEFKGVSSTTIDGLIICELPPISKPPMRLSQTVIDGRHGAIFEELGYSAYDKSIEIGLRGNFDINKVIKYFSGEGDIVFSNEPDKVYHGIVANQIDYNRLLRFRTATITFRVQPFKHKKNEAMKGTETATAKGTSIVVNDSTEAILSVFSIYGKSTQNGTPSTINPVDIVSAVEGERTTISINGSNLVKKKTIIQASVQYGSILFVEADLKPSTQYTFSFKGSVGNKYYFNEFLFTYKNVAVKEGINIVTVTTANNFDNLSDKYVSGKGWIILKNDINQPETNVFDDLMLNEGSIALPYQPFTEQIVTFSRTLSGIPVTDESLATYTDASGQMWCADEIDVKRGVYIQNVFKKVFTGNETFLKLDDASGNYFVWSSETAARNTGNVLTGALCNYFKEKPPDTLWFSLTDGFTISEDASPVRFCCVGKSTLEEWKAQVKEWYNSGKPLTMIFKLATPSESPLTYDDDTMAKYKSLKSNEPTTTIQNDKNAFMKVEYLKRFEVFNEGLEESRPIMVLKGSGTVEIKVNGIAQFTYTFPEGENEVVIDSEIEEAYLGDVLKNRNMLGEFPVLVPKTNRIEWSGDVESIEILPRSRWL